MQPDNSDKSRRDKAVINAWLKQSRGQRAYRATPPAGRAVAKIMKPLSAKFGAGKSGLTEHWEDIVGPRFARISTPLRFLGGREGRTLLIAAPGPAAALITAAGSAIIDRANGYLGPDYIRHIKVQQTRMRDGQLAGAKANRTQDLTPRQSEELQLSLENVTNPELRSALEKLGRQALTRKN